MTKTLELGKVSEIKRGKPITKKSISSGNIPVIAGGREPAYFHGEANRAGPIITVSGSGAYAGFVNFYNQPIFASDCFTIRSLNENKILTKFLFFYLKAKQDLIYTLQSGAGQPHVYPKDLIPFEVPFYCVQDQLKIVSILEEIDDLRQKQHKAIELARQMIQALFSESLEKSKTLRRVDLGNICEIRGGKRLPKGSSFSESKSSYPYIRVADFKNWSINLNNLKYINEDTFQKISRYTISKDDIYISIAGTIGVVGLVPRELDGKSLTENAAKIIIKNRSLVLKEFLLHALSSDFCQSQIFQLSKGVCVPKLSLENIAKIKIPIFSFEEQQDLVLYLHKLKSLNQHQEQSLQKLDVLFETTLNQFFS